MSRLVQPVQIAELADRWRFSATEELPGGHCSRVLANDRHVLKFPIRGEERVSGWRLAVAMSGNGGPDVLEVDEESGALLMERIWPGTPLSAARMEDEAALDLILGFGQKISGLAVEGLMPLTEFVDTNSAVFEVVADRPEKVTLHGDLHHENILLGAKGWVVIDPKGLVGDQAFESSAYLRNPLDLIANSPDVGKLLDQRLDWLLAKTGWPEDVLVAWADLALGEGPHLAGWDRLQAEFALRSSQRAG